MRKNNKANLSEISTGMIILIILILLGLYFIGKQILNFTSAIK